MKFTTSKVKFEKNEKHLKKNGEFNARRLQVIPDWICAEDACNFTFIDDVQEKKCKKPRENIRIRRDKRRLIMNAAIRGAIYL
jgi:hypothetical protein